MLVFKGIGLKTFSQAKVWEGGGGGGCFQQRYFLKIKSFDFCEYINCTIGPQKTLLVIN